MKLLGGNDVVKQHGQPDLLFWTVENSPDLFEELQWFQVPYLYRLDLEKLNLLRNPLGNGRKVNLGGEYSRDVSQVRRMEAAIIMTHSDFVNNFSNNAEFWSLIFKSSNNKQLQIYRYSQFRKLDENSVQLISEIVRAGWSFFAVLIARAPRSDGALAGLFPPDSLQQFQLNHWQIEYGLQRIWITNSLHTLTVEAKDLNGQR